jgi:hypothetical protein
MPARCHHRPLSKPLRLYRRRPTKSPKNMSSRVTIPAPTSVIFGGRSKSSPQTFKFEGWERCYGATSKPNRPRGRELSDRSSPPFRACTNVADVFSYMMPLPPLLHSPQWLIASPLPPTSSSSRSRCRLGCSMGRLRSCLGGSWEDGCREGHRLWDRTPAPNTVNDAWTQWDEAALP